MIHRSLALILTMTAVILLLGFGSATSQPSLGQAPNESAAIQLTSADGDLDPASWVQGYVTEIHGDFSLTLDDSILVEIHDTTLFVGIDSLGDLILGDLIAAQGQWTQDNDRSFLADVIDLLQNPWDPVVLTGTVTAVNGPNSFSLADVVVLTDEFTELFGFPSVLDLVEGSTVEVGGVWDQDFFIADWIELLDGPGQPVSIEGTVAVLLEPDTFVLDQGATVVIDSLTRWTGGLSGYEQLKVGDRILVSGGYDQWSGIILANEVQLLESGTGTFIAFAALLNSVEADRLLVDGGTTVLISPWTLFDGFSSIDELRLGDELWVEAVTTSDPNVFEAQYVLLLNRAANEVEFVSEVDRINPPDWFTTIDGHTVFFTAETVLVGIDNIFELEPGMSVAVFGTVWTNPLEVTAEVITVTNGEDDGDGDPGDGSGLVTTSVGVVTQVEAPFSFVLDDWFVVVANDDTEWRGDLSSFADLEPGLVVIVAIFFGDGLEALSVENIGADPGAIDLIEGTVIDIDPGQVFLLDGGERLIVNEGTVIDGDVDQVSEILSGMYVESFAVHLGGTDYQALEIIVELAAEASLLDFPLEPTHEALVVLAESADPWMVASRHGATIVGSLPGLLVHLFAWPAEPISVEDLRLLFNDPEVEDIGPNYPFADPESIRRRFPVVDRSADSAKYWGQAAMDVADIRDAHSRTLGAGTVVAVIDTGIDPFHPLLRHRIAEGGWDFVDGDSEPWETTDGIDQDQDLDIDESAGHGTFVAGLVLLAAPGTTILPYRVLNDDGHGTTFAICQAVIAAMDRGVDVINMSFAYAQRPQVLDRILDEASSRGIVLVSGAGNDALFELPFPAADHRVLAVAAVTDSGEAADFTNLGPDSAISAPGVEVYSGCIDGALCTWSGTSMAAPLVSGAAALLRSVNPALTPEQIADALAQSAQAVNNSDLPPILQISAALDLIPSRP